MKRFLSVLKLHVGVNLCRIDRRLVALDDRARLVLALALVLDFDAEQTYRLTVRHVTKMLIRSVLERELVAGVNCPALDATDLFRPSS